MAYVTPRAEVSASHLVAQVGVEFFAAMKDMTFNQLVEDDPPQQLDLVGLLAHRAMAKLDLKSRWSIGASLSIEPSHPQWFVEVEGSGLKMVTICDLKTERWEADIRTVFGIPNEADAVWYCETNHTSKLKVCVNIDEGRRPRPLEKVKYVAMLVLAFEEEIDKMLADHVGYINEDAAARSNANNILLVDLHPKQKLRRLWSTTTLQEVIDLMCPDDPSFALEGWDPWSAKHLNELYKYNFRGALSSESKIRSRVEFRQHQGTLSAREIIYWVAFVGGLVELADSIDEEDLLRLVHMADAGEVNITELFGAMANAGAIMVDLEMVAC
ncbi:MAG: hypothetical protein FRX48_08111 [Lasallia pustulata]|uniref:Uncharacterized protein n=1 Tax=Lasallia pustulata TaxID=136370 RepID=A0A5M8PG81_9LECA|nr:MAG: hypothetical protein FRX48_08111 [Lasallia pustulata]